MIYEYAISPDLFADYRDIQLLHASFGKGHGRLFSEVPKKEWIRSVFKTINESGNQPVMRGRLKSAAKMLVRHAGYNRQEQPDTIEPLWLDSSLQAHQKKPFHAILVREYAGDIPEIVTNDMALLDHDLWQAPATLRVERNSEEMVAAILPMLECAREVVLIDRNFNPDKSRFVNFLIKVFEVISARKHGPAISKISYHLGDKLDADHLKTLCKSRVVHKLPAGMKLDVVLRPWLELHDRFVLTDVGGVEFGVGLDESLGGGVAEVRITRISTEDHRVEWTRANKAEVCFSVASTK